MGRICSLEGHMGVRGNPGKMDGDHGTRVGEQIWKMKVIDTPKREDKRGRSQWGMVS